MNTTRLTTAAAPVLALLFTSSWNGGAASEVAAEFFAPDPAVAVQQAAPPTVRHEDHVFVGGNAPPASTLTNPFRGSSAAAEQGGRIFGLFNCDGCHGGGAVGFVGPALSDGRFKYGDSDGEIFLSVFYGRPLGMPAYGGTLDRNSIWQLVTYIQSLQPKEDISTVSW